MYPGIDVLFYGDGTRLEYDCVVAAGADPRQLRLTFAGADAMRVTDAGDLVLSIKGREWRQKKPVSYQTIAGRRVAVESHYVVRAERAGEAREVGIAVGEYDRSRELVIDPVLV